MEVSNITKLSNAQLVDTAKEYNITTSSDPNISYGQRVFLEMQIMKRMKNEKVGEEINQYRTLDNELTALKTKAEAAKKDADKNIFGNNYSWLKSDYDKKQKLVSDKNIEYSIAFEKARDDAFSPFYGFA